MRPNIQEPNGDCSPPPCFFFQECRNYAQLEKQGKSLCRRCADHLVAQEFPLRAPTRQPLYSSDAEIVLALHMYDEQMGRFIRPRVGGSRVGEEISAGGRPGPGRPADAGSAD